MPESRRRLDVAEALEIATAALPHCEVRPGQKEMAHAVEHALAEGKHLVVQAGTGTGKTIAYLVPAMLAGKRTVVTTATKALQDQLATKDLPFLIEHLAGYINRDITFAVLKGRSNYVCRQRLAELNGDSENKRRQDSPTMLEMDELSASVRGEIDLISEWTKTTKTGDMAEITWSPSDRSMRAVSVGSDECPGARRCPVGGTCFSEIARFKASEADIVVVNTHLYGLHVASGGQLLPEHEVLIVDEAHGLEDTMSDTVGISLHAGNFNFFAGVVKKIIADPKIMTDIINIGSMLDSALAPTHGERVSAPLPLEITAVLAEGRRIVARVLDVLRAIDTKDDDSNQRKLRAQTLASRLAETIDTALKTDDTFVPFVSGTKDHPKLDIAPLDVGPVLNAGIWQKTTTVLTSATVPNKMAERLGLIPEKTTMCNVESPFDYQSQAILYCAKHLPGPNDARFTEQMHEELFHLISAAGGRTLALFTSYRALDSAVEAMRKRLSHTILSQREYQKNQLVKIFVEDESSCLFATSGFFQGIDIPGRTLSLVTIDRIPFPRPDDPLLSARREAIGDRAFRDIDLPRAATLLAQATGRLIRNSTDRGVVAVFDPRLGTAGYRRDILAAMPPMRRSTQRQEVEDFLRLITR